MAEARKRGLDSPLRTLLLRLSIAFLLIFVVDTSFRWFAERRFIPFATLRRAVAAGDRCLLVTGGSDTVSAVDTAALQGALASAGVAPCVANLAIGGTHKDSRFMSVREYLDTGRVPSALLIGFKGYDIADEVLETPGYQIGNNAALYAWGRLGDLETYFPEWSFTAADNSLRFMLYRFTALGAYRQALWERVDGAERRVGLRESRAMNRFGDVNEFLGMEEARRLRALAGQQAGTRGFALARFNARLVELATQAGVRSVHFVRLPSLAATERAYVTDAVGARAFEEFMQDLARAHHGHYLDLSHEPWMNDSLVVDGLHFSREGAVQLTRVIGERLRKSTP